MRMSIVTSLFVLAGSALASTAAAFPAAPTITDVSAVQITIGGKRYYDVQATLNGTGTTTLEPYRVPVTLLYPVNPRDCNGTAIVDLLNNTAMILLASEGIAERPLASARARLTEAFLARKGYFYASVQWERSRGPTNVIDLFNTLFGTDHVIPTDDDQLAIIVDAGTLVKAPPAGLPGSPCAAGKTAVYGMSASTVPINALKQPAISGSVLANAFAARFDGVLLDSITSSFVPDPISKTGVKTIAVSAETDIQLFRNDVNVRGENAEYRSYEVAGVTHVSREQHDLRAIASRLPVRPSPPTRQNLATHSAFFRATMEHLRRWMADGPPPPPSVFLDGANYSTLPLACIGLPISGVANIPRDADGNARGGIRLPFVAVPLGRYDGIETQYGCRAGGFPQVAIVTGTFVRDDAILDRYRTHGAYVSAVTRAAKAAVENGWLLDEDRAAFVRAAAHCAVGRISTRAITLDDLEACHTP
jgi:Alpha/beta hydrolase domain